MVAKRPKIVIIGAGMAGLTAAHKLYTTPSSKELFDLCVVEGGNRIGGRINTSEFGGDRIEMGATWIHGILGSPVYKIVEEIKSLQSEKPWECMDGFLADTQTVAEGGFVVNSDIFDPISSLFDKLMNLAQDKIADDSMRNGYVSESKLSIGSFLKHGLGAYFGSKKEENEVELYGNWTKKMLEEAIFAMFENTQRTYTGAGDLYSLDYAAESEYRLFPGEEITIPRGYLTVIEALASVLPSGLIQFGRRVVKIEWSCDEHQVLGSEVEHGGKPVRLHFSDGSTMQADHVIVTVSLGVLKAGIREETGLFSPSLPPFKTEAISRLGYGVVNKLFLELDPDENDQKCNNLGNFPFLQMVFHKPDSEFRHRKIPWWMRKTAALYPIYTNSRVLLSWFAGKEALEIESLDDEKIIDGVRTTISSFLPNTHEIYNGKSDDKHDFKASEVKIKRVLKSKWGTDPLFLGSYSYVAVGSSGDDLDKMAEPLPRFDGNFESTKTSALQILFAGEATHRTHYSTTHGAYFSGLREANRLLQHYQCVGFAQLD